MGRGQDVSEHCIIPEKTYPPKNCTAPDVSSEEVEKKCDLKSFFLKSMFYG